ncbi:MAG: CinA family protein [Gammaproteobacteria bacterium]
MPHSLEKLTTDLGLALISREWKLATAESCTGGGVAYHITEISGSSKWFERGFVTYSNLSKEELLGVSQATLSEFGAVSEETAKEMAEGALERSQAQISLAITGIAGPDGGSIAKPVGTVWFAWAGINQETQAELHVFQGDRHSIREQAIEVALNKLLAFLS